MLYKARIIEHSGEQEHIEDIYVNAPSLEEATAWAQTFTAEFYEEAEQLLDGGYEINGGEIYWRLSSVSRCNTIEVYDVRGCMIPAHIVSDAIY